MLSCAVYCNRPCLSVCVFVCLWVRLTTASVQCLRRLWALFSLIKHLISQKALIHVSEPKASTLNNVIHCSVMSTGDYVAVVRNRLTHIVFHKIMEEHPPGELATSVCSFIANLFKCLHAKSYQKVLNWESKTGYILLPYRVFKWLHI